MDKYIEKNGKKLRYGYTTGSCATAASKAAVMMLTSAISPKSVHIETPKGWDLVIDVYTAKDQASREQVSCYVIKDAGDDPDVTNGMKIYATAKRIEENAIRILGGEGIGRVTKKGLSVPVGEAAINPTPLAMIKKEVNKVLPKGEGVEITISAPEGIDIAKRTFNPKLGIIGGISIIGTSGIVEPMSEEALKDTLKVELAMKKAQGIHSLIYVFGNYGRDYLKDYVKNNPIEDYSKDNDMIEKDIQETVIQKISNFVGFMFKEVSRQGFNKILFVGHVGKMVKVAVGKKNTHSKYGDGRMESIAASAKACQVADHIIKEIFECNTTDEAVERLESYGKHKDVFGHMVKQCQKVCQDMSENTVHVECIIFSNVHGTLGMSEGALDLLKEFEG